MDIVLNASDSFSNYDIIIVPYPQYYGRLDRLCRRKLRRLKRRDQLRSFVDELQFRYAHPDDKPLVIRSDWRIHE